ncbi:MAG: DUF1015 domain-containing protein [Candidatus Omnitrophota bacterium]|nr:DUF1015 domain-containing protein [Candidatus Omnitrophota bacterium]
MEQTIKPFCGTHYNPEKIDDMSEVICPPYDVIDSKQLESLRQKSAYNFSHILLATNGNYKELGEKFQKWIDDKILIDDNDPSLYLYEQKFQCQGNTYCRFGFLGLLRMDKEGTVHPHEHTLSKPKEDRKKMINEMKTNLSPIFVVVPKPVEIFSQTYQDYSKKKPTYTFKDIDGNDNVMWRIDDKLVVEKICGAVQESKLVIADGHHRFEISYDYYQKNKGEFKDLNYVLAFIASAQDGLLILPTHRIIEVKENAAELTAKLEEYFVISKVSQGQMTDNLNKKGMFAFGIYRDGQFYFMELKSKEILDKMLGDSVYKNLDSYLLHHVVLPLVTTVGDITYTHTIDEARMLAGSGKCAFLVRAAALEDVFQIANQGYRMPQKSTYFYPKLVSGAVIRRFRK